MNIEIIVSPTGGTRLETKGFSGSSCREASQFLEAALGQRTGEVRTADYYRCANEQTAQSELAEGQ